MARGEEIFGTVSLEYGASVRTDSDGDLWPSAWADDGCLYAANGDGAGFSDDAVSDIVVSRVWGDPVSGLGGERLAAGREVSPIWSATPEFNAKPTGMVAVDGNGDGQDELYLAVQDLATAQSATPFDVAPVASIVRSEDYGRTWTATESPMFGDGRFTTVMFLDFGQSNRRSVVLGSDDYVYAYGIDGNWRTSHSGAVPDPQELFLARVPASAVQERARWEFFAGIDPEGRPSWSGKIDERVSVLTDRRRLYRARDPMGFRAPDGGKGHTVIAQGGIVYDPPLARYLYTSWTESTFQFYTALAPWGPWKLFHEQDFGPLPWDGPRHPSPKHGGYAPTIPSKFISEDGLRMWVQSNWFGGADAYNGPSYHFSLRRLDLQLPGDSTPVNGPDRSANLADPSTGVVAAVRCCRKGHVEVLNDGDCLRSEDSWNGLTDKTDWWGYTWPRGRLIDTLVFTSGPRDYNSGWFATSPGVQVRNDGRWRRVPDVEVSPEYPCDSTATGERTYTFTFPAVVGSGIRIIGPPAQDAAYTTISELEVYYRG